MHYASHHFVSKDQLSILVAPDLSVPLKEQDNKTIKFRLNKIIAYLCQFRYEIVTSTDCHKKYPLLIVFYVNFKKKNAKTTITLKNTLHDHYVKNYIKCILSVSKHKIKYHGKYISRIYNRLVIYDHVMHYIIFYFELVISHLIEYEYQ